MAINRLLAILIVVATTAFAIGVSIERSQESDETVGSELGHVEGESAEGEAAAVETQSESDGEELLGVDPESVGLVIVAVGVSLLMAAAVWLRPDVPAIVLVVGLAMLAFAALDVREFIHQVDESRTGLAALVAFITLLHAGAAALALHLQRSPQPAPAPPLPR
jgi:hypothetical protein